MSSQPFDYEEVEDPAKELRAVELALTRLRHERLYEFVKDAWDIVEPEKTFASNWHIVALCKELELVSSGLTPRLLVNVPPATMKSLLVSVFWPAWIWRKRPVIKIMSAAYSDHIAMRDNVKMHDILISPWYQELYPLKFASNQESKGYFKNTAGGWRFSTTPGGAATGEHPDIIIIDDPHSAKQADSDAMRSVGLNWFDGTISTRGITRDVKIVLIMQRLHQLDLSGHVLSKGGWKHIMWPMEYDSKRRDPRDPRKVDGELLWPSLITKEKLDQLKLDLRAYGAAGQLQQLPSPEGGGLFKRMWIKTVEEVPSIVSRRVRGWDTAATEAAGDFTVGIKMSLSYTEDKRPVFVIEDMRRGQWSSFEVDRQIKDAATSDGRLCAVREEKEPGSAGKSVIDQRRNKLVGHDYSGVGISGSKEVRSGPFASQCEGGNVYMLKAPWNETLLQELEMFPNGAHDDIIDACSCAFNDLTTGPVPVILRKVSWG